MKFGPFSSSSSSPKNSRLAYSSLSELIPVVVEVLFLEKSNSSISFSVTVLFIPWKEGVFFSNFGSSFRGDADPSFPDFFFERAS